MRRLLSILLAIALTGCSEDAWRTAGIAIGSLGMSALAGATGGSAGPGGAFDSQRYDPARDARYNHRDTQRRPF